MKLIKTLIFLYKKLEKIIFPECCLICGKMIDNIICENCLKNIEKQINLKIINTKEKNITPNELYFEKHIYLFNYENEIRKLIIDYKFNDKSYLYKIFSQIIIKNKKIYRNLKNYDIIIPVPIHKKRKAKRGYNQSELITDKISKKFTNLINGKDVIKKIKYNVEQSSLNKEQRKQNVKNVYKIINKEKIKEKNVILFDDIYTTGATVNEISKLLKECNVKNILILTLSKD